MNNYFKTYIRKSILILLTLPLGGVGGGIFTSCTDAVNDIFSSGEIDTGEKVLFTTMVPDVAVNSRSAYTEWKTKVDAYKPVNRDYSFNIEMWKKDAATATGSATYKPSTFEDLGVENTATTSHDGTLELAEGSTPLYWQDNVNAWGFKATSISSESIETDQSDQTKWLYQDKLVGYSFLPVWDGAQDDNTNHATDSINAINYRTSKQWYADNKTTQQLSGLMVEGEDKEAFKKVPLYMQHQRAWITIILKAGDGVTRDQLAYANSKNTITTSIFSYAGDTKTEINKSWRNQAYVNYGNDKNGVAIDNASTTRYDAIVTPHNYNNKPEEDIIASIDVSHQKFTFAAANDLQYGDATAEQKVESAVQHMNNYNLQPGQHLTIEATLSRASRMVVITAWVEDWTEVVTATVCDDYGQKGDPVIITSKQELLDFLNGEKNKAGYVGIISSNELDLDLDGVWNYTGNLNATLNVAGAKLKTSKQIFNDISISGSLVNGIIEVKDGSTLPTAIANTNSGTIERITLQTQSANSTAKATVAGYVKQNHGTIYYCSSNLPVMGATGTPFVGGIAAVSDYAGEDKTIMPVIDECTVNARVDGADGVFGGGIVGSANGRVTNNTFEYGITLIQGQKATGKEYNFKNIFHTADANTRAFNNAWPTKAGNAVLHDASQEAQKNTNIYETKYGKTYNQVIDQQDELAQLLHSAYNVTNGEYRLSDGFTVGSTWTYGQKNDNHATFDNNGNMQFKLYGNGKTISLERGETIERTNTDRPSTGTKTTHNTAPMLFANIHGQVYDLIIDLKENLISQPSTQLNNQNETVYNAADAIAPLGYSLYGEDALLSNVKVISSNGKEVESATPAGLVVWAQNHAKIEDCVVNVPVRMWIPEASGSDARRYAGGIVACAGIATICRSQYTYDSGVTLNGITSSANNSNCYYGGIVGGTSYISIAGSNEIPNLTLTDNASWYNTSSAASNVSCGSIIGFAAYVSPDANNSLLHSMAEGNEGNWWNSNSKGAGYVLTNETELMVLGKRNSVMPDKR